MRRTLITALAASLLLAGCSQPQDTSPTARHEKSNREIAQLRYECLKAKGWPVELQQNAIFAEIQESEKAKYDSDDSVCLKEAGVDVDAPITEEQYKQFFASYIEIQTCLEKAGWPTPERPSFEAFRATYDSAPWIPWSEVPIRELDRAADQCRGIRGGED